MPAADPTLPLLQLDHRQDGGEIQDVLLEMTGALLAVTWRSPLWPACQPCGSAGGRSVPRVFVDGTFLGGGDDTAAKAKSGELKQLLTSKGIL